MAMMARMRSLAPAFIITVGALFVLFMVISDSNVLEALGGRTNDVGSINGVDISYQEFNRYMDNAREYQKQQTGKEVDEENVDQLRDQVWESIVVQTLTNEEIKRLGITVSDQEIIDVIMGENPPEYLKQNFIDSTGRFNRELYETALRDPQNKDALVQAEEYVRQQRLGEKLQSMLFASITVSEAEVKRKFMDQYVSVKAEYALVDLNSINDSLINLSDNDLQNYYNQNLEKYNIQAQRKLKYVFFSNNPSEEDSINVKNNLELVVSNAQSDTAAFKTYVDIYSSQPYSKDTLTISSLGQSAEKITSAPVGSIIGPLVLPEGFTVFKLSDIIPSKDTYVRASHILINQMGDDEKNLKEAMRIYNELLKGADFAGLARQYSQDPGSGQRGGDLGWFSKGQMVKEFEDASFNGKVGAVQKPVKTRYGYHIIKVTGRNSSKYVVEKIVVPVKPSAQSVENKFNAARDFAYLADENGFEKEAELMKHDIQETPPFLEESFAVPGIGNNKRVIKFAFENGVNSVSDVYRVSNGYVVVKVSEVINPGVKPFNEVKELIKPLVKREKKYSIAKGIAQEIKNKVNDDLTKAAYIDPKAVYDTTGSFTASGFIPSIGRDYKFIDAAMTLDVNKISEPIKGQRGYYLVKVLERKDFDKDTYASQRNLIRNNLLQEKKAAFYNQWIANLKKDADIVDNRHLFFGQ